VAQRVVMFETTLSTDFALLSARQSSPRGDATTLTFAASAPGVVEMLCGNKYADLSVRLERWDGQPPSPDSLWEDCDELPWETVPDGGPIQVAGFDPADHEEGLPVEGLGRARVQVLAAGRHRYYYGGSNEGLPPERWLLRFWPDAEDLDAMAGPPRRVAGPLPFIVARYGWQAATHAWTRNGWHDAFARLTGFEQLERSISGIGRPFQAEELPAMWGPLSSYDTRAYGWDTPVVDLERPRPPWDTSVDDLATLARASGMPVIDTLHDAFVSLSRLGLLAKAEALSGGDRWVPNPAPRPAWEVLDVSEERAAALRVRGLRAEYSTLEHDLAHLHRWAHGGELSSTARAVAIRLSLSPDDVLGTIRLLNEVRPHTVIHQTAQPDADTPFSMSNTPKR
jgi:hypothetical protein